VKLLIDSALSPVVASLLRQRGHDAVHARDVGMQQAADEELLHLAEREGRVIVSADTDFGALLALRHLAKPSFVLLRRAAGNQPEQVAELLLSLFPRVSVEHERGSVVTVRDDKIRIRALPVLP
jgi:predicted nuclease of predicted toxin-antitoxin system